MKNFIIRLIACFIANKDARHTFRNKYKKETIKDRIHDLERKIASFNQKQKTIQVNGKNNHIYIDGKEINIDDNINGLTIRIKGNNNIIEIFTPYIFINTVIEIGNDNCHIKIGKNPTISNTYIRLAYGSNQHVFIGDNFTFRGNEIICDENSGITIGNDCIFSSYIIIRPSDGHSVIDDNTKEVVNQCNKNMIIGDRCWLGARIILTKNAGLSNDTIVAAGSVVTKFFKEEKVIIAGNPAKIVKRGYIYHHTNPMYYNSGNI